MSTNDAGSSRFARRTQNARMSTVDVDDTRPPTFELSLGATLVTLTVAW